jgi:putative ABC transport system permease protein
MPTEIIDIPLGRLALCGALVVFVVALNFWARLALGRDIVVSVLRGTVQLLLAGYVLAAVFALKNPWLVLGLFSLMLGAATQVATRRLRTARVPVAVALAVSIGAGTVLSLSVMIRTVGVATPWYDPRYVIPFAGMLLGNTVNATTLAGERFRDELLARQGEVEERLCLGFTRSESLRPIVARSYRAAMLPVLNGLAVAGIVQLPGMMTGQILGGTSPTIAVKYQLLIFVLILFSVALSAFAFLGMLQRRFTTQAAQLRTDLLRD